MKNLNGFSGNYFNNNKDVFKTFSIKREIIKKLFSKTFQLFEHIKA